jgi:peptidase E
MTKYILVGGYPHKGDGDGKALVTALSDGFTEPIKLLDCLFSRPQDGWDASFEEDKAFFNKHTDKQVIFTLANLNSFDKQLAECNVLYFRGGETKDLMDRLAKFPGWGNKLAGKTVAGSSAGANILSKYYYSPTHLHIRTGLGILDVKVIPHFNSDYNSPNVDWDKAYKELDKHGEKLPVLSLGEGEFKITDDSL